MLSFFVILHEEKNQTHYIISYFNKSDVQLVRNYTVQYDRVRVTFARRHSSTR